MRPTRQQPLKPPLLRRVTGWLTVAGVLALAILSASPRLHQLLHADADHQDHVCAVTLANIGFCDTAVPIVAVEQPALLFQALVGTHVDVAWSEPAFWHPPSCGPPLVI